MQQIYNSNYAYNHNWLLQDSVTVGTYRRNTSAHGWQAAIVLGFV